MSQSKDWYVDVSTVVHEIMHILAFGSSLFAFFRDDDGAPRTRRDERGMPPVDPDGKGYVAEGVVERRDWPDGTRKHYVVLPRVLEAARQYFDCPSLERVPLEEFGGDGSAHSHWDQQIMYSELMTSQVSNFPRLSNMTMALLEDTGWYKPDYGRVGPFRFGRGSGCEFITDKCVQGGNTNFPGTFCTDTDVGFCGAPITGAHGCTTGRMAKAVCTNCIHEQSLPVGFQYFDNPRMGGDRPAAGYCPLWEPYMQSDGGLSFCHDGPASPSANGPAFGEAFGSTARCIQSTAVNPQSRYSSPPRPLGTCFRVECEPAWLRIFVGGVMVLCSATDEGTHKLVTSATGNWHGYLVCPPFAEICGGEDGEALRFGGSSCQFPGVLRHGRCFCAPGSLNDDCSVKDLAANRDSYPYGLRYMQDEISLSAFTSVSRSEDLRSWPLRPQVVSGPWPLQYTVSPMLPDGLVLIINDGTLTGTPLVQSARTAYTIRAAGGAGTATATLVISVTCPSGTMNCSAAPNGSLAAGVHGEGVTHLEPLPGPGDLRLLRTTLLDVQFSSVREDPGLGAFAGDFIAAVSGAVGYDLVVTYLLAVPEGGTQVESRLLGPGGVVAFADLVRRIVDEFRDEGSSLRSSAFGSKYLGGGMKVYAVNEDGVVLIWPEPPDDDGFTALDLSHWPFVACVLLFVSTGCSAYRPQGRSISSKVFLQIEGATFWIATVALLTLFLTYLMPGSASEEQTSSESEGARYEDEQALPMVAMALFVVGSSASAFSMCCVRSRHAEGWAQTISAITCVAAVTNSAGSVFLAAILFQKLKAGVQPSLELDVWQLWFLYVAATLLVVSPTLASAATSCLEHDGEPCPAVGNKRCVTRFLQLAGAALTVVGALLLLAVLLTKLLPAFERDGFSSSSLLHALQPWLWALCIALALLVLANCVALARVRRRGTAPRSTPISQQRLQTSAELPPRILGAPDRDLKVVEPDAVTRDAAVLSMLDMGFKFEPALMALREHGWSVSRAATTLSSNGSP